MENNTPLVSVIVPIYGVEAYLPQCVDSVLSQTYSAFELILVDDESPDRSPEICDAYAAKDSRIRVIHKRNGGLSDARNAGLDVATGKYIYFLDGDDYVHPSLLETLVPLMEAGNDMVAFRHWNAYSDGRLEPGREIDVCGYHLDTPEERKNFIHTQLLPCKLGWEAWSRIFLREKIERYGLRYADNRVIFSEDLYFSLCYCAHAEKIQTINDCLYYYRLRQDSIMGVQIKKSNIGRIHNLCKAVLEYLQKFEDCTGFVEDFHRTYYQIMGGQFVFQLWSSGMDPLKFRQQSLADIADKQMMETWLRKQLADKTTALDGYTKSERLELRCHVHFLLGGSWQALRLQCKLIRMLKPLLK